MPAYSLDDGTVGISMTEDTSIEPACETIKAYRFDFIVALRVCVSIACVSSLFGATLIIGTFLAFKELRTKARQLLVQLSITDFLVAISHLIGVNVNLPKFMNKICLDYEGNHTNITDDLFCQVQGGVTVFSTISSYLWTIAVAYYLLMVIVFESQRLGKWMVYLSYPICWGLPAVLTAVIGYYRFLGFRPNIGTGKSFTLS